MQFMPSPLSRDLIILEPDVFEDQRGPFMEMYHREKFEAAGITPYFVQDNRSRSLQGTVRGLHYQIRRPQGKLIWALSGEIFDVALDIRRHSPSFGKWFGIILSEKNKMGLYIPPNFAHGYAVLSKEAEVFYKCTDFYAPEYDRCIRWNDPDLAIDWPIRDPILSHKDLHGAPFQEAELPN